MKLFLFFITFITLTITGQSQTAEDSVKAAVNKLFEGMKSSDATILKSAFADSAILQTITKNKEGKIAIETGAVDNFASLVSKQPKGFLDEQIVFDLIKIDGPLAIVWTPYKFYFNGIFSHCGVDSFQLLRINGRWKIIYLIDTRRKQGCKPD